MIGLSSRRIRGIRIRGWIMRTSDSMRVCMGGLIRRTRTEERAAVQATRTIRRDPESIRICLRRIQSTGWIHMALFGCPAGNAAVAERGWVRSHQVLFSSRHHSQGRTETGVFRVCISPPIPRPAPTNTPNIRASQGARTCQLSTGICRRGVWWLRAAAESAEPVYKVRK